MRIVLIADYLDIGHGTGIRTVTEELVKHLALKKTNHTYVVVHTSPNSAPYLKNSAVVDVVLPAWPGDPRRTLTRPYQLPGLLKKYQPDIIHDLSQTGVFVWKPSWFGGMYVATTYDTAYLRVPQFYAPLTRLLNRFFVPKNLRAADHVMTISEHSRADITASYGIPKEKISVLPLGVKTGLGKASREEITDFRTRYHLTRPYFFYLGALTPHKNIRRLVEAFAASGPLMKSHDLVIAGPTIHQGSEVVAEGKMRLGDRFHYLAYLPDKDVPAAYSGAETFVFPSLYEGFGLPVLEALACGTPVVSSNAAALPEVGGKAALYFNPKDSNDITLKLEAILDTTIREQLAKAIPAQLQKYSWQHSADILHKLYKDLYENR